MGTCHAMCGHGCNLKGQCRALLPSMLPCTHGDIVLTIPLCTLLHSCTLQFSLLQSQYDVATLKDLRKVEPNIRCAIMCSYEVWSESDA